MACGSNCELCGRLREAVIEVVVERGIAVATLDDVASRAGVASACARTHAGTLARLIASAYGERMCAAQKLFSSIARKQGEWEPGVAAGIDAMLASLAADPVFARFALLEVPTCARLQTTRTTVRRHAARMWASLYVDLVDGPWPPLTYFEWLSGAFMHEAAEAVRRGDFDALPQLRENLVALAALEPPTSVAA